MTTPRRPAPDSQLARGAASTVRQWWLALTALALTLALVQLVVAGLHNLYGFAVDYQLYLEVTRRWLAGGGFYQPWQLAGPYGVWDPYGAILYPPVALWLFIPFTVLPAFLWWLVPLAVVAWTVWRHDPDPRAWPVLALCLAWPPSIVKLVTGNPVMWAAAAVALGTLYAWPAVFAVFKPSVFPFALLGVRSRGWWLGLVVLLVASVPFGAMWVTWLITVENARGGGLFYSVLEVPLLALPLVAWAARRRPVPGPLVASPAGTSRWLVRGRGLLRAWRGGTVGQAGP